MNNGKPSQRWGQGIYSKYNGKVKNQESVAGIKIPDGVTIRSNPCWNKTVSLEGAEKPESDTETPPPKKHKKGKKFKFQVEPHHEDSEWLLANSKCHRWRRWFFWECICFIWRPSWTFIRCICSRKYTGHWYWGGHIYTTTNKSCLVLYWTNHNTKSWLARQIYTQEIAHCTLRCESVSTKSGKSCYTHS